MSRRKQSNPKSLKSEINPSAETTCQEESEDPEMSDNSSEIHSDGWEQENGDSSEGTVDQSASLKVVTSSKQLFSTESTDENPSLREEKGLGSPSEKDRASPPMATSEGGGPSDLSAAKCSVSAAEISKVIASTSYLAAALKASIISTSSSSTVRGQSEETPKQGSFSPPDSPTSAYGSKVPHNKQQQQQHILPSLLKSAGLSDLTLASCLLKSPEATVCSLSSMIQGIPLLSSVLPALQRLGPLSSLQSVPTSAGGGIMCVCGVKFNSTSNLEAHRLFYCSHRQVTTQGRDRKEGSPTRDGDEGGSISPTGRLLKCPHCTYTTTHKLSLNGHMNIHTNPEDSASQSTKNPFSPAGATVDPRAQERYCSDCDIQFSSMKTYRVHKAHYCQTRHVLKGAKSPAREEGTSHGLIPGLGSSVSSAGPIGGPQPILALNTNPVILLPYSMIVGAQLLPPHILPQLGAAFVLPNGQVHPIPSASPQHSSSSGGTSIPPLLSPGALAVATAAIISASSSHSSCTLSPSLVKGSGGGEISPPASSSSSCRSKSPREEEASHPTSGGKRRGEGESPLDLTTKRPKLAIKTDLLNDEEKENRETLNSDSSLFKASFGGGEFEGKLLSSPPSVSPSINGEDNAKSSRPSSVVPRICSPRAHQESPRPSTSAISSNSRSPGQTSPVSALPQNLPPLTSGFPGSLVNSLESLGATTLPLASLQCLQSLQNVPRELALKLISPDLLINGLAQPVLNPPVIVKQGEAKCNECNIVFYKEESLQIHKKHYCSARDTKKVTDEEVRRSPPALSESASTAPLRSPGRESASSSVPSSATHTSEVAQKPSKPLLQFICTACGIKFSSPDNLTAHQTYYCPKREGAADEAVAKGVWRCPRCRIIMAETMQAAHQCVSPSPAPSHGWKCPCCPVLSPTAAAAQKHLETHAGIKAFRCTICGYRGNTLRGMRTHIRMHFEKRTNDLQEENFIACILEEEDHSRGRSNISSEARKLMQSTRLILENTTLSALMGDCSSDQSDQQPLSCAYCPFITPIRSALLQHLTLVHKIGLETSLQEIKNLFSAEGERASTPKIDVKKENENGTKSESPPLPPIKLEPEVKLEIQDNDEELSEPQQSTTDEEPNKSPSNRLSNGSPSNGQCYCHTCNISFSLLDSYVAHKRFYCSRSQSNSTPETAVQ